MIEHAFREDWRELKRRFPTLYAERIKALERIAGGKFKRVVATETGKTHAVPVETLATEGIKGDELEAFPEWNDDEHGGGRSPERVRRAVRTSDGRTT